MSTYPGTEGHQALLKAVVGCYGHDRRVRGLVLFGSLARGNWNADSDLDLDAVLADGISIDIVEEAVHLSDHLDSAGELVALAMPDGLDEVDVILHSLHRLSIRFHPLASTSPNVISEFLVLSGDLDADAYRTAGKANRAIETPTLDSVVARLAWYALYVDGSLRRRHVWRAVEGLHAMRGLLMVLFARTREATRPVHFFESSADADLQARLGATLPGYDLSSARIALIQLLQLIQYDFALFVNAQFKLDEACGALFGAIKDRQVHWKDV